MPEADTVFAGVQQHGVEHDPMRVAEENTHSTLTTVSSSSSPDEKARNYGPTQPAPLHRTTTGVSVERAEADFAELSRELSGISQGSKRLERHRSRRSRSEKDVDIEKVDTRASQRFDLEVTLRGQREMDMEVGIRSKRIGVLWDDLRVCGIGGVRNFVKTFPDAFLSFFNAPAIIMGWAGIGKKGKEFDILRGFRGLAKPGEMVLVLGKPSSGCTTFLKVIANQRFGYTKVEGEMLYGPYDAKTFSEKYRGEAVYNQEDDVHHPSLTVGQTLGFALDTKIPGKRPGNMSKREFKLRIVNLLLKMFNIEHTRDTAVGNQFIRGISGGERKRISIAEMMITSSCVCAWDNSTRGLDASTALDYAKSLRIMTNIYKTTTFVSLYQASENIYQNFDKVLVIDAGRQVFFGPASEARAYFEGLGFLGKPRMTTPDYLTSCTDPFEREYADGMKGTAPNDTDSLARAFENSKFATRLSDEIIAYRRQLETEKEVFADFEIAHHEAKRKHTSKSSVYSAPFHLQIWSLMQRQFLIKWGDKFTLCVSWITSMTVAVLLATVWLNLPLTSAGAFPRGGLLFISLLFNTFQAFGELGGTMLGRPIVNKHRSYTFHRPSALWLAQIFIDIIFAAAQIFVFSLIVYFSCGLVRDAGAFFTFYLTIVTGYLGMTLFFRTIGCLCADFDVALKSAVVVITLFVVTSGYLIQYVKEQVWLRWIFYINILGLGFSTMMMNEFQRIDFPCIAPSLIPYGPSYNDINYQVCTLAGANPGSDVVSGSGYVSHTFQYSPGQLWRNWGLIIVLIAFFLFLNIFFGEKITWGAGGRTVTFYAKENKERKDLNEKLNEKRAKRQGKGIDEGSELHITSKAVLTWENLCYDVPVASGQLRLLRDVFGFVKPGQLTALMGASGAGKTTLLDVLAARKNIGVISGDILVDGSAPGTAFQRGTSYAEQLDVHEGTQTVREALRFSATLRQPYEVSQEDKFVYVEEIISLLEMEDIADAIIGSPESGLAVEQRKRVTIGVELAAKPELLLFLDEPTSGLDSQSAFNIVRFLRKLAAAGQCILCTIHQPNSALFENFDRLLLLQKGGQCVYFGEIGKDAHMLLDYFRRNGADCPKDANPAEWMLDAIGAGNAPRIGDRDWGEIWQESPELANTKEEITAIKDERVKAVGTNRKTGEKEYATPLWHQIKVVQARTHLAFWRSPDYGFTRIFNHIALALVAGLSYLQLDNSRSSLQYRVFIIFQVTIIPALILAQVEPKYDISRLTFYRESAAKAYRQLPFSLGLILAEMPYSLLCAVGFFLPIYYIPGFQSAPNRAGYQFLMVLLTELFAVTLGQMLAAITPSSFISMLLNPFVVITFGLLCGVTIPAPQIPGFWRAWLYQLDPWTRLIGGMVVTELEGRPVVCAADEYNVFNAPPGQNCGSYMGPFFAAGGAGYIADNASSVCQYCAYSIGNQFYEPLGFSFDNRWRDLGIVAAFVGSNLIILFIGSRYLNFNRR